MADDPLLERWNAVADYQVKFINALGEYQVNAMKALNLEIEAETKAAERDIKREVLRQLQLANKRLARARVETERESKMIQSRATDASFYYLGEGISPTLIAHVWIGYRYFITKISSTEHKQISGAAIEDSEREASNFFRNPQLGACESAPADKKTVSALINWLIKQNYIPVRDSPAAVKIDQVFQAIAEGGQTMVDELEDALNQLETRTFKTFDPLKLVGLPSAPSTADK